MPFVKGDSKAGRPKGSKSLKTIEREKVLEEIRQRIATLAQPILDSQYSLARGLQFLYRIDKDEKGNKKETVMVTDPEEIRNYLDGHFDGEPDTYYYITVEKPNNQAIDSMFNRAFGKPVETQNTHITGFSLAELFNKVSDNN